ncbi:MAG: YidH family protein [Candidatus Polarisedimenticolia bacterium]
MPPSRAVDPTLMAADRTLMAWVRTSVSLIGLGFTIYKFFEYLDLHEIGAPHPHSPRRLGLYLVIAAVVPLGMAMVQYFNEARLLAKRPRAIVLSPAFILAVLTEGLGVLLLLSVAFGIDLV